MKKLLWLDCCCRKEASRTNWLSEQYAKRYGEDYAVERLRLYEMDLRPMSAQDIEQRDEILLRGKYDHPMLRYAAMIAEADEILISAPYWDLSFPSVLKVFFEWASACGVTFCSTQNGLKGLCRAKKAVYISTAGGAAGENLGYRYVRALMEMFGVMQTDCILAEGLDIYGADVEQILHDTVKRF